MNFNLEMEMIFKNWKWVLSTKIKLICAWIDNSQFSLVIIFHLNLSPGTLVFDPGLRIVFTIAAKPKSYIFWVQDIGLILTNFGTNPQEEKKWVRLSRKKNYQDSTKYRIWVLIPPNKNTALIVFLQILF